MDFFYFVNGRFPTVTGHTFVPRGDMPLDVGDEEINIIKLYEKKYLATLNNFFGGNPETSRKFLTELNKNLTVAALLTDNAFSFEQLTDISAEIKILLIRLVDNKKIKEEEDEKLKDDIGNTFDLPEASPKNKNDDIEVIEYNLNIEPENVDEKIKQFEPYIEPTLETLEEIEEFENNKREEENEISEIMYGADGIKTKEKIEKAI